MKSISFYPYQKQMIDAIIRNTHVALHVDMGAGKTVCTLTAIKALMPSKVLIVAPKYVATITWPQEMAKWRHLYGMQCSVLSGTKKARLEASKSPLSVHVISIDNLAWLIKSGRMDYDILVLDEASLFKNHATKRFKALKSIRSKFQRIIELTGTPAANGLMGLWSQMYLLDGGERLGKYITHYRNAYFFTGRSHWDYRPMPNALERITRKIGDICVRVERKFSDVKSTVIDTPVHMQLKEYKRFVKTMVYEDVIAANKAVLTNKLRQLTAGGLYGVDTKLHDNKIREVKRILDENYGQRAIICVQFKFEYENLRDHLKSSISIKDKNGLDDWLAGNANTTILISHPRSISHGLNLQHKCHIIIWYSLPWSLEVYAQTNARLVRQGQTQTVQIHRLIAKDTIDEQIAAALSKKDLDQNRVLSAILEQNNAGTE